MSTRPRIRTEGGEGYPLGLWSRAGDGELTVEDHASTLLYLELGDIDPGCCADRARRLSSEPGVIRATWWENAALGRTDLPMRVTDGRTLLVVEADGGFTVPAAMPGTTEAHCFRRHARPSQGVLTGARPRGC